MHFPFRLVFADDILGREVEVDLSGGQVVVPKKTLKSWQADSFLDW
jgi:hypothetical protein